MSKSPTSTRRNAEGAQGRYRIPLSITSKWPICECKKFLQLGSSGLSYGDFSEIWDHMFLSRYLKRLTLHEFVHPPTMILDLGCGSGFWAIEASKQWQVWRYPFYYVVSIQSFLCAILTGFDNNWFRHRENPTPTQRFGTHEANRTTHRMDTRQSVRFLYPVTGRYSLSSNSLDGLPFPPQHFDFVRASGLGLAIPENEWQSVLEVNLPGFSASYMLTMPTGNSARYESWGRLGGKFPKM